MNCQCEEGRRVTRVPAAGQRGLRGCSDSKLRVKESSTAICTSTF